jgi:hypothetical protein
MTLPDSSGPRMRSMTMEIAPADIAFFKAVIESYDNLATLRTEDPERHHLKLWFDAELEADINELLASLAQELRFRILKVE